MSHLIEEYAKSLGVKIGKPKLLDHFYPTVSNKYITIHSDNKIESKHYEYFPQVIKLIKPFLEKNGYKIYQVGGQQDPVLENTDGTFLNLNLKQSIYLIKNSSLHLGIDSLPVHIASVFDIPIVALYSHTYAANAYPYWSSQEKIILFESEKNGNKPSFSYQEDPKTIRTIKPEKIAKSVLKLLDINDKINFETIKIGSFYHKRIIEIIPNFFKKLENDDLIYLRADLHFDEEKISYWCQNYKCKIISDKVLPLNLLNYFSKNIEHVFFKMDKENIPIEYFENLKNAKINFTISTKNKNELSKLRNLYFDFRVEFDDSEERMKEVNKHNCLFFTNKIMISDGNLYPSEAHLKAKKQLDKLNETLYDDDLFWKDLEHFYLYKISENENS